MAFFRKSPEIFGLDIGSSGVRALHVRESGGSHTLTSLGVAPLPPDAITDGTIKDPTTVVEAIRSAVSRAGLKGTSCAIAVCGRELIIKKVQIPEVPAKEVGDVDSFALGNQFELNYPGDRGETVALIDIGASIMKTNVVRGGSTIFARDIPFGGNNYTQAIAQQLKIPFEQAEAAKLGRDVGVRWETVVPALEAVSRELSLEVQRTFDYFASTAESERIGKIVLAGGCSLLPGLNDYLSSNGGIPVELARPFERFEVVARFTEGVNAAGPALAVAVGLALRRPGDKEK